MQDLGQEFVPQSPSIMTERSEDTLLLVSANGTANVLEFTCCQL